MNWFWLNIPLVVLIGSAVVAPVLLVTAREPLETPLTPAAQAVRPVRAVRAVPGSEAHAQVAAAHVAAADDAAVAEIIPAEVTMRVLEPVG